MGNIGDRHAEVWYNDDSGVMQRILVCPDTNWEEALEFYPGAKVVWLQRWYDGRLRPVTAMWEAPKCEMCGTQAWIFVKHPLNGKQVCLECRAKGTEGWAPCPATHKDDAQCPLCRATPGFVEEL